MSGLRPFIWPYSHNARSGYTLVPVPSTANHVTEQYVLQFVNKLKDLDVTLNYDLSNQLRPFLKERIQKAQKQQLRLIHRYLNQIDRSSSNQSLSNRIELSVHDIMNELTENLEDLQTKARLMDDLKRQHFHYLNVAEYDRDQFKDEQALERMLIKKNRHDRVLCSSDTLNSTNQSKLNKLRHQLVEERKTNQNLTLIYADFSYCYFNLSDMMILPSTKNTIAQNLPLPFTERVTSSSSNNDVINILLLGETGVGKSTFINAFVNYLTFDTFSQAETNTPVALMPVSFLMTTGHHFDEQLVRFGDFDSSNTEDFDHPGQSVTQLCKSYQFNLQHTNGKYLCIIDTPGFGDTRGLDQDDTNMQHVLKYINNLTHLNAVCFLLKSNSSRLHVFFRTCLTQLLDLLGPNVHQNIIFCFTNTRSTFYNPGDTAPILRTMLNSLSINDIPFNKQNTFCFDNESFRYLVALKNRIQFDDEEKHEYKISWANSVTESKRLLKYIYTQLNIYSFHNGWKSIKHAQIQINSIIRPMLEAIRNILRNRILREKDSSNKFIQLHSKPIHHSTALCYSCKRDPFPLGNFWILPDDPHQLSKTCLTCSCHSNQHIQIDYLLSYHIVNNSSYYQQNQINDLLNQLCLASAQFAYFLVTIARSTKEDPFRIGLMRMIKEEKQICAVQQSSQLNLKLVSDLEKLLIQYEEQIKKIQFNQKQNNLTMIYEWIKTVNEYQPIKEQVTPIQKKGEQSNENPYNFDISEKLTYQGTHLSTVC